MTNKTTSEGLDQALAPCLDRLITPALVIDLDAVQANLAATLRRVGGPQRWRPHLKTSKQAVIIELMLDAGLRSFKVATCDELALLLRTAGPRAVDVLFAYPAQRASLSAVLALARAHAGSRVQVLADSPAHLDALAGWSRALGRDAPLPVMLDVDLGMHRTGTSPARWRELAAMPDPLELAGLHGYDGHLTWAQRDEAHQGYDALIELAAALRAGPAAPEHGALELVTSGTHSYAHALDHPGLGAGLGAGDWRHSVSPGTIVLSDRRSHQAARDIGLRQAAFVATRVISAGPERVTLDAGSKAIAPDVSPPSSAVLDRPELEPQRASEEHLPCRVATNAHSPELGRLLWLVPEHVCTTVNLYREAVWIRGGRYVGVGPVGASGHACGLSDDALVKPPREG
ncbi:alanine racemase [Enhygromyxa salina]|nr:alanine racemase [Enhygromyxa salina]